MGCQFLNGYISFFGRYERWSIVVLFLSGLIGIWGSNFIFTERKFPGGGIPFLTAVRIIPGLIFFITPYIISNAVSESFPIFFIISYFIFMAFEVYLMLSKLRPEIKQPK